MGSHAVLWLHEHVHHSLNLTHPGDTRILRNPAGARFSNPDLELSDGSGLSSTDPCEAGRSAKRTPTLMRMSLPHGCNSPIGRADSGLFSVSEVARCSSAAFSWVVLVSESTG